MREYMPLQYACGMRVLSLCVALPVFAGCAPGFAWIDYSPIDDDTADTDADPLVTNFDCDGPLPAPPFQIDTYPIQTQEDFDFSADGLLVYVDAVALVGATKAGDTQVLAASPPGNPRGVHGLADGRVAILSPWDGTIKLADPATGGLDLLLPGLDTPNGVEVDLNDRIYFAGTGEVGWIEPDGSDLQIIDNVMGDRIPNGITLSPDEDQITVAVPEAANTEFYTVYELGPGQWGNPQLLHTLPGFYGTVDSDMCGNIYTVDYGSGELWRIRTDGTAEWLGELPAGGLWGFSALRFGPGQGGWRRDRLYATKRNDQVFEVYVGVPGRRHPTTP